MQYVGHENATIIDNHNWCKTFLADKAQNGTFCLSVSDQWRVLDEAYNGSLNTNLCRSEGDKMTIAIVKGRGEEGQQEDKAIMI